ncbi:MAG: MBOAT family protein [Clostridia bacterium]|nr:MBOAT family protein [Clostridia bacterium]
MVFSSLIFLFAYLTVMLLLYYTLPKKWRNAVLFTVSLIFYGWGEPAYIVVMLISILAAYLFGFLIDKHRESNKRKAKLYMVLSLCSNLVFLLFFKYCNFFIENLSLIPFLSSLEPIKGLVLPVGISFYTFQIMSYTIDLYRGHTAVQRNFVAFGTYVTLFPQLIAGPIVRYRDIDDQLITREHNVEKFSDGIRRFCAGLAKKVLLADTIFAVAKYFQSLHGIQPTVAGSWMIVICYTFQIYFDFSGYSDMAIGLGKMIGFEFLENFNYPYMAGSITDFWRRWHMSLSTWFKEYVYIPLGGNRKGLLKQYRNIAIVWLLTGFWHGANWNFILWGVYFGALLMLEKTFILKVLNKIPKVFSHIYALLFIAIGWLIFFFTDMSAGWSVFTTMFGFGSADFTTATVNYDIFRNLALILICVIGSTPYPKKLYYYLVKRFRAVEYASPVLTCGSFLMCVAYMVDSTFSPFLYYNF